MEKFRFSPLIQTKATVRFAENDHSPTSYAFVAKIGGLAFSEEGILFFANHGKSGTIGKYRLGQKSEPETFIDLSEWISSSDDQDLRVEGLRIDAEGRL